MAADQPLKASTGEVFGHSVAELDQLALQVPQESKKP